MTRVTGCANKPAEMLRSGLRSRSLVEMTRFTTSKNRGGHVPAGA